MKRLAATLVAVVLALTLAAESHAATHVKAPVVKAGLPQGPCDENHILDIEIIDGVLYECGCDKRIFVPDDCGWQEITSQAEDPMRFRRLIRIALAHHHRVIRIYVLPAVTA